LCAKTSWLESSWGKLMPGIRHWKPRQADGEADWKEQIRPRSIAIEAGEVLKTIAADLVAIV